MSEVRTCNVRILRPLNGVFANYQPVVGGVYEAQHKKVKKVSHICIIKIKDKMICLRDGEYEFVED